MAEQKREENSELKNLKRVLKQVDRRIVVPKSLNYTKLRALIEDEEPPKARLKRLPGWLSPQSGLAYAAAFFLIVALVYSTETYKPNVITGGMAIPEQPSSTAQARLAESPPPVETAENAEPEASVIISSPEAPQNASAMPEIQPKALSDEPQTLGVGGGNLSSLLLSQDGFEYRWRPNDAADPDHSGYVSLEVIDTATQEITGQIDIDNMLSVSFAFAEREFISVVGVFEDTIVINTYSAAPELALAGQLEQPGALLDAKVRNGILRVVSLSDTLPAEIEVTPLPNALDGTESCVITSLDLNTLNHAQKAFSGAKGSVQVGNSTVIINYEGVDETGAPARCFAPIFLDGMSISLGAAS